ncbi:MAG: hypothetical protein QM723_18625 [Myxococcaceae bacterium]
MTTTSKAVRVLNHDLAKYTGAQKAEAKHLAGEKKANAAAKTHAAQQTKAVGAIQKQEQTLIDQFVQSPPTDPAAEKKLLEQLFALGQKEVQTKDSFQSKIAADKKTAAQDARLVTKDKAAVKADRKQALKDLKPAEYEMGLKQTNHDRKLLGLKALTKPLRPPNDGQKTVDAAKSYLGKREDWLEAHGVTFKGCPYGECCANFVSAMLHKAGKIPEHSRSIGVIPMKDNLLALGWHKVPLKDAKPGDVWITSHAPGAPSEEHTELVASNKNGHVKLIGSNNISSNMQQISYDDHSAYIRGSYILAPPAHH